MLSYLLEGDNMNLIREKNYNLIQNIIYIARCSFIFDKSIVLTLLIIIPFGIIIPVSDIIFPKIAVELLTKKADVFTILLIIGSISILLTLFTGVYRYMSEARESRLTFFIRYFRKKIFLKALNCKYCISESTEFNTKREAALMVSYYSRSAVQICLRVPALIIDIACFLLYSSILSTLNIGIMVYLIASAIIVYMFARQETICAEHTKEDLAKARRKFNYVIRQCQDIQMSKDIRIYNMSGWLTTRMKKLLDDLLVIAHIRSKQGYMSQISGAVMDLIRDGIAYTCLIIMTIKGNIGLGDFMLHFGAITGFSNWVVQIIYHIKNLRIYNIDINALRTYLDIPDETNESGNTNSLSLKNGVDIQFEHVSFRYPEASHDIIHDISFHIHNGEHIALVGLNGSGKTTLVKLMTGLYEPQKGTIYINGKDIRTLNREQIFSAYSIVFQDFMILPATLGENIALKPEHKVDKRRTVDALIHAGLYDDFKRRGITLSSYMTHTLSKEGIILSGGEKQKLMLARALYKNAPFLVLDEPTSALDPLAEKNIYEKYQTICKEKTALFISHRLASTQFSDRIFLLKDGNIIESGTHDELYKADGEYARLYKVQSHYYNTYKEKEGNDYGF